MSRRGGGLPALAVTVGLAAAPLAAGPLPPPCADPASDRIHHWRGDGNAEDSAGTTDGTESGGVTYTAARFGQGFSFDGVDDSVSFGATVGNFGTSDFTVSYWIRTVNATEFQGVLGKRPLCLHGSFWDNRISAAGTMSVELDQDAAGTNYVSRSTSASINDGAFHLASFVRQGPDLLVYLDGVLSASGTTGGTTNISNAASLIAGLSACTGGVDGTQHFTGALDDIKIYDRALSPCEILADVDAGLDVDLDGQVQPLTDMLLLLRYYFGFRDASLINGAVGLNCLRCDAPTLELVVELLESKLDVDGNGTVEPLSDALLLLRYAFGFRGGVLIANACTNCNAMEIEAFLDPLFP